VNPSKPVLVVMGVSGSGKSTVGKALAARLDWAFQEGDDLHPSANVARMSAGVALTDDDRAPWLAAVGDWIDRCIANGGGGVITCSALKAAYRRTLTKGRPAVGLVYLESSPSLIAARIAKRSGHFMPASLIDSQFADLEPPGPEEDVVVVAADLPTDAQVDVVIKAVAL
jgi:carbohydrate kinase (thermoresistant glucokinase family)